MSLVVRLTPGKSLGDHTEDRTYALKLTRRRVKSTTPISVQITPKGQIITHHCSRQ
jgi:hypothetical protein